jgi:Fe-S cluster assembly iron-binding protein IscA
MEPKKNYNIALTKAAITQIKLMKQFDYTLEEFHLRASIKGKECDGFRYAVGFTAPRPDDIVLSYGEGVNILLDPFVAQYFFVVKLISNKMIKRKVLS